MNTPLSWIKEYVPELETGYAEFNDKMTLSGTKVESVEVLDDALDKIFVGQILKIDRHPDADKLVVCQVKYGKNDEDVTQIVTGAQNVFEGAKIPVVLDGGKVACGHDGVKVPGGMKIKAGKLRGVESNGMMCSIEELGSNTDMFPDAAEDGIYILPEDSEVGVDAIELLGFRDAIYEYEITSNRVDCYSVLGIAREAAATYRKPFVAPVIEVQEAGDDVKNYIDVEIKDTELCKRFTARVVKNVKIAPSPKWMQDHLRKAGIRPINNIVDITNYVMEEYGQPMHAYDARTIAGNKITVKRAADGDTFTTLDGEERTLDSDMLMICDESGYIGLAGIMGGENSKIVDDVQTVIFECATFDGTNIRLSSKRLGHRTDASGKYEKGLDPNNTMDAVNRACMLVNMLGAGEVVSGVVDVYPNPVAEKEVKFEPEKINSLLGINLTKEEMLSYFKPLEFRYDEAKGVLIIPTFRQDIECMNDVAEEVARFYGYDNIPTTMPTGAPTFGGISKKMKVEKIARNVAQANGFSQGMTYSFESPKVFDKLTLAEDDELRKAVEIINPLGKDFSIMRTSSLNGMLTSLSTNYNRRNKNVRLYELANVYLPKELVPLDESIYSKYKSEDETAEDKPKMTITELPDERMQFTLGMYGDGDFFTMKGVVEEFFEQCGFKKMPKYNADAGLKFLHPGRQAEIVYGGRKIGFMGELHPEVADNYEIGERVYLAVVDMPAIMQYVSFARHFESLAKFPAITRDLSMTVPKNVTAGQIEEVIGKKGGKLLESCKLFDIYEGVQIKMGYKSMAYSLVFRAKDRSLEDKDIQKDMEQILDALKKMDIELRA